jgi:hypothetical protein
MGTKSGLSHFGRLSASVADAGFSLKMMAECLTLMQAHPGELV